MALIQAPKNKRGISLTSGHFFLAIPHCGDNMTHRNIRGWPFAGQCFELFSGQGAVMGTLQRVRFKPSSLVARYWEIAPEAVGALMCSYRMPRCCSANHDRVDVRFRPDRVIWGVPATELEMIGEGSEPFDANAPKSQA